MWLFVHVEVLSLPALHSNYSNGITVEFVHLQFPPHLLRGGEIGGSLVSTVNETGSQAYYIAGGAKFDMLVNNLLIISPAQSSSTSVNADI